MYTTVNTIRSMSGFDSDHVSDETVMLRMKQASYIVGDHVNVDIAARTIAGTLTDQEKFELSIGEAEIAVSMLCFTLALQSTLNKDNKSVTASNGGISYRDSVKNTDFLKMAKEHWAQSWIQMGKYVDSIPDIAGSEVDPYTNAQFSLTKNYDTTYVRIDNVDQVDIADYISFLRRA